MAEYIKREDAYTTLTDYYHHSTGIQHMVLKEALDRVPAADVVERKTGKWIHALNVIGTSIVKCSECGYADTWYEGEGMGSALFGREYTNFCPNCGAKMSWDGEDA